MITDPTLTLAQHILTGINPSGTGLSKCQPEIAQSNGSSEYRASQAPGHLRLSRVKKIGLELGHIQRSFKKSLNPSFSHYWENTSDLERSNIRETVGTGSVRNQPQTSTTHRAKMHAQMVRSQPFLSGPKAAEALRSCPWRCPPTLP